MTKYGQSWNENSTANPISAEFRKLIKALDANAEAFANGNPTEPPATLYRKGCCFYALRHSFRTVADETRDLPAIDLIMGHADDSMASRYRERISDERLVAVTDYVHRWLFGDAQAAPATDSEPASALERKDAAVGWRGASTGRITVVDG